MSTNNISFYEDLTNIIFQLSSNTHLISSSVSLTLHFFNTPMQMNLEFYDCKDDNFLLKIFDIFFYFCAKHRLWVHIRTRALGNA